MPYSGSGLARASTSTLSGVAILVRLGDATGVDAAVSVYERSNLARRHGDWPNRTARVEHVRAHLRDPGSWFLLATDGAVLVGTASAEALRAADGAGPVIPGGCFLNLLYVVPERWGEGIGGVLLDAVLAEARRRHHLRIHLWTKTTSVRIVSTAGVAFRRQAEPWMAKANGRARFDGVFESYSSGGFWTLCSVA
jgi:GNAT superfamily N-acetyltransferase